MLLYSKTFCVVISLLCTLPIQNLIEVFDNVLEETNVEGWQELQSVCHPQLPTCQ